MLRFDEVVSVQLSEVRHEEEEWFDQPLKRCIWQRKRKREAGLPQIIVQKLLH